MLSVLWNLSPGSTWLKWAPSMRRISKLIKFLSHYLLNLSNDAFLNYWRNPTCYIHNSHVNTKESYLVFQRNTFLFIKFFLSGQLYKPWAVLCSPQWCITVSWLRSASEEPQFQLSYLACEKDNQTLYALHIALHMLTDLKLLGQRGTKFLKAKWWMVEYFCLIFVCFK